MLFASTGMTAGKQKNTVVKTVHKRLHINSSRWGFSGWRSSGEVRNTVTEEAEFAKEEGTSWESITSSDKK